MSIERARRDLSIDTIIRKKGSLYTEIFPFLSTSGLPKSVTMLVERHNSYKRTLLLKKRLMDYLILTSPYIHICYMRKAGTISTISVVPMISRNEHIYNMG